MDNTRSKVFAKAGRLLLWAAALFLILWMIAPAVELLRVLQDRQAVIEDVEKYGLWGPLALAAAILLQLVIAVIPGHILGAAAGYLYGFANGFLLSWITVVLGGQALFYLTRTYGKPFAYRLASERVVDKWEQMAERQGFIFYLFVFFLPIFPDDAMVYVAGLSKIPPRSFFLAQVIGRIPGSALMSAAGAYGFQLSSGSIVLIVVASLVLFFVWWRYGPSVEQWIARRTQRKAV